MPVDAAPKVVAVHIAAAGARLATAAPTEMPAPRRMPTPERLRGPSARTPRPRRTRPGELDPLEGRLERLRRVGDAVDPGARRVRAGPSTAHAAGGVRGPCRSSTCAPRCSRPWLVGTDLRPGPSVPRERPPLIPARSALGRSRARRGVTCGLPHRVEGLGQALLQLSGSIGWGNVTPVLTFWSSKTIRSGDSQVGLGHGAVVEAAFSRRSGQASGAEDRAATKPNKASGGDGRSTSEESLEPDAR